MSPTRTGAAPATGAERYAVHVAKEYFHFCTAHFLIFPDGSRETLHGHNYRVAVRVAGPLDAGGVVIDFLRLKPIVKELCAELDHRVLLPSENDFLTVDSDDESIDVIIGDDGFVFPAGDVVLLPIRNSSAEHLARYLCEALIRELGRRCPGTEVHEVEIEVEETNGQSAIYRRSLRLSRA